MYDFRPEQSPYWAQLSTAALAPQSLTNLFTSEPNRLSRLSIDVAGLSVDLSKNLVSQPQLDLLLAFAESSTLSDHRAALFNAEKINETEDRAVLHTALRDFSQLTGISSALRATIAEQRAQLLAAARAVHSQQWLGSSGKAITDIINIGIGGSDLGPRMAYEALREYRSKDIRVHFIANVDGAEIRTLLAQLDPETTLTAIASKTFTTQETLLNAKTALQWYRDTLGIDHIEHSEHVVALTAAPEIALAYGIHPDRILPFETWVGGRYSLWSSVGFGLACAIGPEEFMNLLSGAHAMDVHFAQTPFDRNLPVLMALIGLWYINFKQFPTVAVIPYCERLGLLSAYLQQLDMESNGKSSLRNNHRAATSTAPILWGQTGTNGQHAFFQLLHQGTHVVPVDFIAPLTDALSNVEHHTTLLMNMLAQAAALMTGKDAPEHEYSRHYPGNKPSTLITMETLNPHSLGALVALYEHKVFVQGSLWGINSFDQWGVELGKQLTNNLLGSGTEVNSLDPSTQHHVERVKRYNSDPSL